MSSDAPRWQLRHISRGLVLTFGVCSPALAQDVPSSPDIIVYGDRRLLGALPDSSLTPDDIAAYGLGTVGELLDQVSREQGRDLDEPLILVNGKRVSGLGDIDSYPTEAIESIEILPPGAGLRIGASATRRVFNLILKPSVRTQVGRAEIGMATEAGLGSRSGEVGITAITRPRRLSLTLRSRSENALFESDRKIAQAPGSPDGLGSARTLRPEFGTTELQLSAADQIAPWLDGSISGRLVRSRTRSGLGLASDGGRLQQRSRRSAGSVDLQLNGDVSEWLVAFAGSYSLDRRRTDTGRGLGELTRTAAFSRALAGELTVTRALADLPAGPLSLSLRGAVTRDSLSGSADRFVQWSREVAATLEVPIAVSGSGPLAPLGELSAGVELSRNWVSRIGAIGRATYSLRWQPAQWVRLAGSISTGRSPPAVDLVAGPLLATPGVPYLDPLTGETVDVVELSGANPSLGAQRDANQRLSVNLKPFRRIGLTLTADYLATRNRDLVTVLPAAGELLLAAFPERFERDGSGTLVQVDVRPVSFLRQSDRQLRTGLELNLPLGRHAAGGSRLQFNVAHIWLIKSELQIREGLGVIDLLSRQGFGLAGGGRPRHEVEFSAGYSAQGRGVRLTGQYRGPSFLNLGDSSTSNSLRFSPLATLGVRAFADAGQFAPAVGWLNGTRVTLFVTNIFNDRQKVRDSRGFTPLRYQPAYLDPGGRTVRLELRRRF